VDDGWAFASGRLLSHGLLLILKRYVTLLSAALRRSHPRDFRRWPTDEEINGLQTTAAAAAAGTAVGGETRNLTIRPMGQLTAVDATAGYSVRHCDA
jgi:hypothetical protein